MNSSNLLWLAASIAVVYGTSYVLSRNKKISAKLGLSLEGPFIVVRTSSLAARIERFGRSRAPVFRLLGDLGIIGAVVTGVIGFAFLHFNFIQLLLRTSSASPVVPLIPGWTIGFEALPFFTFAVLMTLFPHELMHALVAAAHGIPVKSAGAFLAVLFPGGFAELDENELSKQPPRSQARVFAAGSFANILVFLLVLAAIPLLVHPLGVRVISLTEGSPASGLLQTGDVIVGVGDMPVRSTSDFATVLSSYRPGDRASLTVIREGRVLNVSVILSSRPGEPEKPMLGVYIQQAFSNEQFYNLLWWTAVVSGSVALLNMLPLYPLDGGRLLSLVVGLLPLGRKARAVTAAISAYAALLLVLNVVLSFVPSV